MMAAPCFNLAFLKCHGIGRSCAFHLTQMQIPGAQTIYTLNKIICKAAEPNASRCADSMHPVWCPAFINNWPHVLTG